MPTYLVERYVPRAKGTRLAELAAAGQAAARQTEGSAAAIRYLATTLVPGDELCYCLFDAPSIEALRRACELAQITCGRIVEAFHATAHPPGGGTP